MSPGEREELVNLLPRLRRFARSLVGNSDDADDLLQTACERAIKNIHQWQRGTRLDSWMYRIVQSAWIDSLRARRTRDAYAESVAMATPEIAGESIVVERLTLAAVQHALQRLPPEQRAILLLVCVEQLSYVEAAAVLEIPIGTVMSRLARGRLALRSLVEGQEKPATIPILPQGQVKRR